MVRARSFRKLPARVIATKTDQEFKAGLTVSVVGHIIIALLIFVKVFPDFGKVPEPVV